MDSEVRQADAVSKDWFDEDAIALIRANDKIDAMRMTIASMLAEIEDIFSRQNPRIEVEWQLIIGSWENKLLEAQIDMRRAKRRYSLVQAKVNSGAPIDIREVEEQLDTELSDWMHQLDGAVERYERAVSAQERTVQITMAEADEQKRIFRILAKRLHPDLHPNLDESTRALFALAQMAYRQADLKMLKSLEVSTAHLSVGSQAPSSLEEAQATIDELQAQVDELQDRIEKIKQDHPYCLKEKLDDAAWVEEYVSQLKGEIEECKQVKIEYSRRSNEIAG